MKYEVVFEPFAERHFIKTFAKKYQGSWEKTYGVLVLEFSLVDLLFEKTIAEAITDRTADVYICKTEFKIAGTAASRHGSGNRCIVAVCKSTAKVHVLLVYCKTDIDGSNETAWWKGVIKQNYSEYKNLL